MNLELRPTESRGCEEEEGKDVERSLHGGTVLGQSSGGTRVCTAGCVVADRGEESQVLVGSDRGLPESRRFNEGG